MMIGGQSLAAVNSPADSRGSRTREAAVGRREDGAGGKVRLRVPPAGASDFMGVPLFWFENTVIMTACRVLHHAEPSPIAAPPALRAPSAARRGILASWATGSPRWPGSARVVGASGPGGACIILRDGVAGHIAGLPAAAKVRTTAAVGMLVGFGMLLLASLREVILVVSLYLPWKK